MDFDTRAVDPVDTLFAGLTPVNGKEGGVITTGISAGSGRSGGGGSS
jgi:hypothetical protein